MNGKVAKSLRRIAEQLSDRSYSILDKQVTQRQIYKYLKKTYKENKNV